MNYHDYITVHLCSVIVMVTNFILYSSNTKPITYKILGFISFILTGLSGVVLAQRFGLEGPYAFPRWIIVKYAIWISMAIVTLILSFKLKDKISLLYWPWILLSIISTIVSIYKPL